MSVQTQIDRITRNITTAFDAVGEKGGTVPAQKVSGNLASAIRSIQSGGNRWGVYTALNIGVATMRIPENQSITVEITEYANNVTMEGETV